MCLYIGPSVRRSDSNARMVTRFPGMQSALLPHLTLLTIKYILIMSWHPITLLNQSHGHSRSFINHITIHGVKSVTWLFTMPNQLHDHSRFCISLIAISSILQKTHVRKCDTLTKLQHTRNYKTLGTTDFSTRLCRNMSSPVNQGHFVLQHTRVKRLEGT